MHAAVRGAIVVAAACAVAGLLIWPARSDDAPQARMLAPARTTRALDRRPAHQLSLDDGKPDFASVRTEFRLPEQARRAADKSGPSGVHTVSVFSRYWVFLTRKDKSAIERTFQYLQSLDNVEGGLRHFEPDAPVWLPPAPPEEVAPAPDVAFKGAEPIVRGGITSGGKHYAGAKSIIVVVDSGIDFRHEDFIKMGSDGQPVSRLMYYWDTLSDEYDKSRGQRGLKPPIAFTFPNGAHLGTLYDRNQLTEDIRSGKKRIPQPDQDGHGTACASVAAGNGRSSPVVGQPFGQFAGVAPEADIIGIRIGNSRVAGLPYGFLLGVFSEWLQKLSEEQNRPVVVTCSFGQQTGGRDGFRIEDRELSDRYPLSAKKRALLISAGNEREDALHAHKVLSPNSGFAEFSWVKPTPPPKYLKDNKPTGAVVRFYVDGMRSLKDLEFDPPATENNVTQNPFSMSVVYEFEGAPEGSIKVKNATSRELRVDAYLSATRERDDDLAELRFSDRTATMEDLISAPATTASAITVGSYEFNDGFHYQGRPNQILPTYPHGKEDEGEAMKVGELSYYSCPGFLRKGTYKPDVTAPGQYHTAAAADYVVARFDMLINKGRDPFKLHPLLRIDTSRKYTNHNGTSAATPYTAGIVALMFDKNPNLTLGQVKQLLHKHAKMMGGTKPNKEWGYGKLDVQAVERIMSDPMMGP